MTSFDVRGKRGHDAGFASPLSQRKNKTNSLLAKYACMNIADAQDALSIVKVDQDLTLFSSYEAVQSKTQLSIGGVD